MNILNINSYFEQSFYENLFSRLREQSVGLDVCVPCYRGDKRYDYLVNKYDVLKCYNKIDRYFIRKKIKKVAKAIMEAKEVNKYDLIHAHSLVSNGGPAYEIWKKTGINYVVAVRSSDLNTFLKLFLHCRSYFKKILFNSSRIIFISESGKSTFLKLFKYDQRFLKSIISKFVVIPNGIDSIFFLNKNSENKSIHKPVKVLFCGVNKKVKNSLFIAKAISKYNLDCSFTIVGKAVDRKIEKKLSRYNFVNRILETDLQKMPSIYSNHDIFAMISLKETFGLTYIEALSQGLPILYTKNTGIDGQFSEGEVGFHVDKDKMADFYNGYKLILERYSDLSKAAKKQSELYNWDYITKKYILLYRELIHK